MLPSCRSADKAHPVPSGGKRKEEREREREKRSWGILEQTSVLGRRSERMDSPRPIPGP